MHAQQWKLSNQQTLLWADDTIKPPSKPTIVYAPCTFSPASTWIRIPVILVFFASMMNAATVSSRKVSCFSTAAFFRAARLSAGYLLPYWSISRCHELGWHDGIIISAG